MTDTGRLSRLLPALLPALAALALFLPVLGNELVMFDDDINIYNNPLLGELTPGALAWMFADDSYMPRYMPLGWLQLTLVFESGGLSAIAYHAVNYVLHAANALLVWCLAARMLRLAKPRAPEGAEAWPAAIAACLWALHPLRVEPVAWATGVHYVHATFWALLAANLAALRLGSGGRSRAWLLAGAWAGFLLSSLVYPVALGFPVAWLSFEWWLRRNEPGARGRLVREHCGFFAVSALALAANIYSRLTVTSFFAQSPSVTDFGVLERLLQAAHSAVYYMIRPLVPGVCAPVRDSLFGLPGFYTLGWLSVAAIVVWTVVAWRLWKRVPGMALWSASYAAICASYYGLLESPFQTSDRYTYFPMVVWCLGGMLLLAGLSDRPRRMAWGVAASWTVFLAFSAGPVFSTWEDSDSLYATIGRQVAEPAVAALYGGRSAVFHARQGDFRRADALLSRMEREGAPEQSMRRLRDEVRDLKVLASSDTRLSPDAILVGPDAHASHQLALVASRVGEARTADVRFRRALEIAPGFNDARYNYAVFLAMRGRSEAALDQYGWLRHLEASSEHAPALARLRGLIGEYGGNVQ